jgi:hypothetical protein
MEYAGYKPTDIVDWAGLTGKVADKITAISKDREARKQELDDIMLASQKELSKGVDLRNQSLQNVLIDGADQGRTLLNKWNADLKNGTLDPKTYKQRITNLNDYWLSLAGSAQTYDQRYEEVMSRQKPDENGKIAGSSLELELASRFGAATELKNKKIRIGEDGMVFLAEVDPNTGEIIRDITDTKSLNRPENMIVNRVYVNSEVEDMMKGFKANTQIKELARGGSKAITSIKANDFYKESKARIASTIAPNSNPRAQLSVLVDNGAIPDPEYYETESEKQQKLEEIIAQEQAIKRSVGKDLTEADIDAIELRLIKLSSQDGVINPVLTKKQQELAIQTVEQTVDMSVETLVDYNAPESYNYNRSSPQEDTPKEVWYGDYEKAYNAVMGGKLSVLNNMTGGKFNIEYEEGRGYTVKTPDGKVVGNTYKIPITNVDGLQEYLGISSLQNWTKQKEAFNAAGGLVSKPASDIPTGTRAEFKAAGWTEAQINQGIKEGSIKVK